MSTSKSGSGPLCSTNNQNVADSSFTFHISRALLRQNIEIMFQITSKIKAALVCSLVNFTKIHDHLWGYPAANRQTDK